MARPLLLMVLTVAVVAMIGGGFLLFSVRGSVETYTINGLTCPISSNNVLYHVSNDSRVIPTIEQVIQSPKFLAGTKGMPYGFYYASLNTVGPTYYKNSTTPIYTALELGFATYGASTPCVAKGLYLNWIDVQVPLQNGTFDVAAESVHSLGPPI
ncbi:MAG TPA: hypothetical protein VEC43_01080 [Candidatus Acidoferrales bacterium]|nr:hypothetical protein [Candidatus Acidoferrales bacterium]